MIRSLREAYEMACHNLLCYSRNCALTAPKNGYETEWAAAKEKVESLGIALRAAKGESDLRPSDDGFEGKAVDAVDFEAAVAAALNGYKADVISRDEAKAMVANALYSYCAGCQIREDLRLVIATLERAVDEEMGFKPEITE